jgi:cytochrome c oxidase cbb3-type subunit 3/ubiquinol-cytochrome c reductase cytochrome c subunit
MFRRTTRRQCFKNLRWLTLSLCHVVALSLPLVGCDLRGKPKLANKPVPANEVKDFGKLYAENCAGCHGTDGTMGPAPPLNDALFLTIISDATLAHVIADGRAGTLMPAFLQERGGTLTPTQVRVLAEGLKKQWGAKAPPKVKPPPYEMAGGGDPKRGEKAYNRACGMCHGPDGGPDMPDMRINDPVFLSLISDQALRRLTITGRPDLGMPDFAGKRGDTGDFEPLSVQEVTDLVAYMASWRKSGPAKKDSK